MEPNQKKTSSKDLLKYSGMAFEMAAFLLIGMLAGKYLDKYFHTSKPYFLLSLSILMLTLYMIRLVKDVSKK